MLRSTSRTTINLRDYPKQKRELLTWPLWPRSEHPGRFDDGAKQGKPKKKRLVCRVSVRGVYLEDGLPSEDDANLATALLGPNRAGDRSR